MLLTYRNKTPVIGFSRAYIKAGATAGIYSTPEQIASDAIRNIERFFRNGNEFDRKIIYPESFSIEVNKQVAESMRLTINEKDIMNKLKGKH